MVSISSDHPLSCLFRGLVAKELASDLEAAGYIANLLLEFVDVSHLYRIRNARGSLVESNPMLDARSFDREREVRKHIGDFTLFLTGMFPEYVAALPRRGLRLDSMIDYVKAGKESYRIVAAFDQFEYRHAAPLFRRLAEQFEYCVYALNRVKTNLETMRQDQYRLWRLKLLDN